MARIEVIYFSGYGHTAKQAQAVLEGAQTKGDARLWAIPEDGIASEELWSAADAADAIIFGAPTYMGGVPWQFKRFIDATAGRWQERGWADKITGGFTNSGSPVGDKGETMNFLRTFTAQQGMLWVPLNQLPASTLNSSPEERNWAGGTSGPLAVSPVDAGPDQAPRKGDLLSAHDYGARVAGFAQLHAAR